MKRFIVFAGDNYYPCGGAYDFMGEFEDLDDAMQSPSRGDWYHIFDTHTGDVHEHDGKKWTIKPIKEVWS